MRSRWLTGWNLSGVLVAPVMAHALNAKGAAAAFLFIAGGTLAMIVGARVSARWRGRNPHVDGFLAGGTYPLSSLAFLALVATGPPESQQGYPPFVLYGLICLALFGALFGLALATYYGRPRPLLLALGLAAAALLAGLLIFVLAYLLAGGNILVVYGLVSPSWKVPVGLLISGFIGSLVPGRIAEALLGSPLEA